MHLGRDDGFNVHGNFIVVRDILDVRTVRYIDESGPGWVTAVRHTLFATERKCHCPRG